MKKMCHHNCGQRYVECAYICLIGGATMLTNYHDFSWGGAVITATIAPHQCVSTLILVNGQTVGIGSRWVLSINRPGTIMYISAVVCTLKSR